MNYEELKDGKYIITLKNEYEDVWKMNNNKIAYVPNKEYVLIVNKGTYSVKNDANDVEEISTNFSILPWFNVKKI